MKSDYCAYPQQLAADVEIVEQLDGERAAFIVGSASAGSYLLLRETEYFVLSLVDGSRALSAVCDQFRLERGGALAPATLIKFLAKLDQAGILAGERAQVAGAGDSPVTQSLYLRLKLFNPEKIFARSIPYLRWIWTTEFVVATLLMMLGTLLLSLMNWSEVTGYGAEILRDHFGAVFAAGVLIIVSHEFAHGLTCKAFGGRTPEVGVLLVFYFLPGLYCNVSGIHLIPQRSRRLWVILAGIYWQLLVGTLALLCWFVVAPYTLLSDLAFIFFFGSVLNLAFNANPLIKLDGYYFLSQWLRLPNLMDRSRAYWRGLGRRLLFGERNAESGKWSRRERVIYAVFGLLSFTYSLALGIFILSYVGEILVDRFYVAGLLATAAIALLFARQTLKQLVSAAFSMTAGAVNGIFRLAFKRGLTEGKMATLNQMADASSCGEKKNPGLRRRLAPLIVVVIAPLILVAPWRASVGNYGTLVALPNQETIIRAPESATLIALRAQPGEQVARGAVIGRMGNLDVEDQAAQVASELARVNAEYDRLLGEMRTKGESAARADLLLQQRQIEYRELNDERRQIAGRRRSEMISRTPIISPISFSSDPGLSSDLSAADLPPALAVLQSEIDLRRAQSGEANAQLSRARKLFADGLLPRSELDAVETRASTLAIGLAGARDQLNAALIEHRRKHANAATEVNVANSDLGSERLQIEKLGGELHAIRTIIASLEARRELLRRKQAQFELVSSQAGAVFGEELPRMMGQYFQKGSEICRVVDTRRLLVRIQVPEREIGDVSLGRQVRLKARSFPDRVFLGVVTKIGGESEQDQNNQATYRVELTIENVDGLLRPGMTAFARIDFDRQMIGRILLHKIKQSLRPEMWML